MKQPNRYVALFLRDDSYTVRAIDAPDMVKARFMAGRLRVEGRVKMFTSDQAEHLKNALEHCESKRKPDAAWKEGDD